MVLFKTKLSKIKNHNDAKFDSTIYTSRSNNPLTVCLTHQIQSTAKNDRKTGKPRFLRRLLDQGAILTDVFKTSIIIWDNLSWIKPMERY